LNTFDIFCQFDGTLGLSQSMEYLASHYRKLQSGEYSYAAMHHFSSFGTVHSEMVTNGLKKMAVANCMSDLRLRTANLCPMEQLSVAVLCH